VLNARLDESNNPPRRNLYSGGQRTARKAPIIPRPFQQRLAKAATIKRTILNRRESWMRTPEDIDPGLPPVHPGLGHHFSSGFGHSM
jgi:hypothetical protein